ncbi:MAG: metalloregulator ArsR/SmtB family transcription factor [Verrucomicrobiota bacterium]
MSEERVSRVFKALSDTTRRGILMDIARKDATAGELAEPYEISLPAVSKHLKVLEGADLVTRIREGKTHRFHLNEEPLKSATKVIEELSGYWNRRLKELDDYFKG